MSTESDGTEVQVQWRVVWFPPDRHQRSRVVLDEQAARRLAADVAPDAPIIERREVTTTPWEIVGGAK